MQSSREQQGEIRKPSSAISAKKEENNRMGKTRELFIGDIGDIYGTFHARMDTIRYRNGKDLTKVEEIKR